MKTLHPTNYVLLVCLISALTISLVSDIKVQKIPNLVTYPLMGISLLYYGLSGGINGCLFSASGLLVGIGFFIIPYIMGGMGAGDAKLMGAVGSVLGAKGVFEAFLYTAIIGGFYALLILAVHREFARSFIGRNFTTVKTFFFTRQFIPIPENANIKKPRLCYGVAIALGTFTYIGLKISGKNFLF
jgi:prepilin peptidase CpaA